MLLIHLRELPTHLHVHSSASHILCKGRKPPAVRWEQGPKSSESLLFLQRTFMSSGSITNFHPAESPLPLNVLLSLVHGKMQLLSRFPAAFSGYPMEQHLTDHCALCLLAPGEGNNNEITCKDGFFFPPDLACPAEIQEGGQQTVSRDSLHPLRKLELNSFSLIHEKQR